MDCSNEILTTKSAFLTFANAKTLFHVILWYDITCSKGLKYLRTYILSVPVSLEKKSENSPTIIGCDTFFLVKKMNVKIKSNQMKDNSCISKKTSIFHHWYFIYVETSVIRNKEVPKCLVKCSSNMFKNETHIVLFSLKNGIKVCCLM